MFLATFYRYSVYADAAEILMNTAFQLCSVYIDCYFCPVWLIKYPAYKCDKGIPSRLIFAQITEYEIFFSNSGKTDS
jgi:hypothetical protein